MISAGWLYLWTLIAGGFAWLLVRAILDWLAIRDARSINKNRRA
jgi:hypothetical protein